jgi:hypothetical protein
VRAARAWIENAEALANRHCLSARACGTTSRTVAGTRRIVEFHQGKAWQDGDGECHALVPDANSRQFPG